MSGSIAVKLEVEIENIWKKKELWDIESDSEKTFSNHKSTKC